MFNFCRPGKLAFVGTAVLLATILLTTSTTALAQRYQVFATPHD